MIDIVEILQHWRAGRPKSVVASSVVVDAKTVAAGCCSDPDGSAAVRMRVTFTNAAINKVDD